MIDELYQEQHQNQFNNNKAKLNQHGSIDNKKIFTNSMNLINGIKKKIGIY